MSECTHDCSTCGASCSERAPQSLLEKPHEASSIKKVIAVVSGKGGVGKSLVTSLMAVNMRRREYGTAILDADVTGPSIPKAFGIHDKAAGTEIGILPNLSKSGIEIMSVNLMLENETDPVIWRGPVVSGLIKQFWQEVIWNDVDFMFVDMPPGTGDVPLTVFQSLPIAGIIIVTSPQELVSMIVEKAVKMADMMNIPILGIVENMSYFVCDECGKKHYIYGESHIEEIAERLGIDTIAKLPFNKDLAGVVDKGLVELYEGDELDALTDKVEGLLNE